MAKTKGHVVIRDDECKGCELCVYACPFDVLSISSGLNIMGYHPASYEGEGCTGCGICFYTCPEPGAITVFKKWADVTEVKFCPSCGKEQKVFQSVKAEHLTLCTVCLNKVE